MCGIKSNQILIGSGVLHQNTELEDTCKLTKIREKYHTKLIPNSQFIEVETSTTTKAYSEGLLG